MYCSCAQWYAHICEQLLQMTYFRFSISFLTGASLLALWLVFLVFYVFSVGCMILVVSTSAIGGCRLWQPVQADSQPKSSGLVLGRRPLGIVLHSSNELGELSQFLCHDDSTINIVLDIIIIIQSINQSERIRVTKVTNVTARPLY